MKPLFIKFIFKTLFFISSPPIREFFNNNFVLSFFKICAQTLIVLSDIFWKLLNEQKIKLSFKNSISFFISGKISGGESEFQILGKKIIFLYIILNSLGFIKLLSAIK